MDERFRAAQKAIVRGDHVGLAAILESDPSLATAQSSFDHPNLLQCLVLTTPPADGLVSMIDLLVGLGADPTGPLIAASGIGNLGAIARLIDLGARIDGGGRWSPLEEALYWGQAPAVDLLLREGAGIHNLRTAAALGDLDRLDRCFGPDGRLTEEAGVVEWPFASAIPEPERSDRSQILGNALVFAASWDRHDAVDRLLDRGADVNLIPAGFDFAGTPLHYAGLRGHRSMVDRLIARGADPGLRDTKIGKLPEDWAAHDGHQDLADHLRFLRLASA